MPTDKSLPNSSWLLLIVTLPTASATARMRIWRALKTLGCAALRDGAYLMPAGGPHEQALQALADRCGAEGGSAWLMAVQARSTEEAAAYCQLFDRSADYAALRQAWREAQGGLTSVSLADLARLKRKLQRELESVQAVDYFAGPPQAEAALAWAAFSQRIDSLLSPGEPEETAGQIPRREASHYQGRTWATRRHLWVDRVCSAWLIRRFIDPQATFRWLAQPSDCPKRALGFDFDGATFTHVGERVTFETLMASFGLEGDPGLDRLAAIVHVLDIGGEPVAEAQGFEAVVAGTRARWPEDDNRLLAEVGTVLDSLYAHFVQVTQRTTDKGSPR